MYRKSLMKFGKWSLILFSFFVLGIFIAYYIIPTFAGIYQGELGYGCDGNPCPAWVNVTKGDMFFADGNQVFIVTNFSCSSTSLCNENMTVTGNFSQIGGSSNVIGLFKEKHFADAWAIFELNDTVNLSTIGGLTQIAPKTIFLNATDGNLTSNLYNDEVNATVMLVNMSTFSCPPEDQSAQFPEVPGWNESAGSPVMQPLQAIACTQNTTLCTYMDNYGPGTWNGTHWLICAPIFGGDTTNLTFIAESGDFSAIPNFTIDVPGKGKIVFQQNVSFDSQQESQAIMEFAIKSVMSGGKIGMNDSEWNGQGNRPNLNMSATLTIYNISKYGITGRPQIYRYDHRSTNGTSCPVDICSNFNWDGENVTFTVSGFSDYGLNNSINVTLNTPTNLNYSSSITNFTFTPEWSAEVTMKNCTLYSNFTGSWKGNTTNATPLVSDTENNITVILNDGSYLWNVYCFDVNEQYDYGLNNWTVFVDTVNPQYSNNATNPANGTGYSSGGNYQFNITWTDTTTSINEVVFEWNDASN